MEYQTKKMQKHDELIKSRDPVLFNANVFKNVKLVMSEEEQQAAEQKVRALATFLKEQALPNLIKNYARNEGTPSDSQALGEFFHQNGVNMRYLGQVADLVKDSTEHFHLKYMLEREVIVRCLKHLVCKYVKECQSDELIGATVSHIFNCIFAPRDFVKRMDEKEMAYNGVTIQASADLNLLENMQKLNGPNSAAEAAKTEVES